MKKWLSGILAILAVCFFRIWISDNGIGFTNSIASVLLFVLLMGLTYRFNLRKREGTVLPQLVLGFVFSILIAWGSALKQKGSISFSSGSMWFAIWIYGFICTQVLEELWSGLKAVEKILNRENLGNGHQEKLAKVLNRIFEKPCILLVLLLLCWMPCYISTFPGGFTYDATREYAQVYEGYSGDFPLLHSVLIIGFLNAGYSLTGSYNVGIAAYTVCQMVVICAMFVHILTAMYKRGVNRCLLVACAAYYAFFPVIHMLVTCTVRDVLFSALLSYSVLWFYLLASDASGFMSRWQNPFFLALVFVLTLLARNNNAGLVILILLCGVCGLLWIIGRKRWRRGAAVFCSVAMGGYAIFQLLLAVICQPLTPSSTSASMSVLTQSLVRAYITEGEAWTQEEKEAFDRFFVIEELEYVAENADASKDALRVNIYSMDDFLLFWARMGVKYPSAYGNAILANTYPMWFPGAVADGYQKSGVAGYQEYSKCYFSFTDKIASPGTHQKLMPNVRAFYKDLGLGISFERLPVVSMLFSIGFQLWFLLNTMAYLCSRRKNALVIALLPVLAYTLLSAFVPLVLLRYFAALFFTFPIVAVFAAQPEVLTEK